MSLFPHSGGSTPSLPVPLHLSVLRRQHLLDVMPAQGPLRGEEDGRWKLFLGSSGSTAAQKEGTKVGFLAHSKNSQVLRYWTPS